MNPTLRRCARCGLDHEALTWNAFKIPIVDQDGTTWTHWSTCPSSGDPILARIG